MVTGKDLQGMRSFCLLLKKMIKTKIAIKIKNKYVIIK